MNRHGNTTEDAGLKFFGRISASISHELKNAISIINESAGLLDDLMGLAEEGKHVDTARTRRLSKTIQRQVQRANQIIRNLNRFSHLVDEPFLQIELTDFLYLVTAVTHRLTENAGVRVSVAAMKTPVSIVTRPFHLHQLLWRVMEHCIHSTATTGELTLSTTQSDNGACVIFNGTGPIGDLVAGNFQNETDAELLSLLSAELRKGETADQLSLFLKETPADSSYREYKP